MTDPAAAAAAVAQAGVTTNATVAVAQPSEDSAKTPAPAPPVLTSINLRRVANGLVLSANFQMAAGLVVRPSPNGEYIFAGSADMLAWLKTQGWDI
jgi:hypothetical protein